MCSPSRKTPGHLALALSNRPLIFCLNSVGVAPPTRNLEEVDPLCAELDYLRGEPRPMKLDVIMTNNFAFGGINTSLILREV